MLAKSTYVSGRGNRLCSAHHWVDNETKDCPACEYDFNRDARNITFALGLAAACWQGWRMPCGLTLVPAGLHRAGLWTDRGVGHDR